MKWMISANDKMYDHAKAFAKWGYIDWRQHAKYSAGDIVYIYCTKPYQKVMYKTKVIKANMPFSECQDDKEFWIDLEEYKKAKTGTYAHLEFNPQIVACGAAKIRLMYDAMLNDDNWDTVRKALNIEKELELNHYEGREKGSKTKEVREILIREFQSHSAIETNIPKGKNLKRVFWAIADKDDLDEIQEKVFSLIA